MNGFMATFATIGMSLIAFIVCYGIFLLVKYIKNKYKGKIKTNRKQKNNGKYVTFTKRWFAIILKWGIVWVNLSYILAFLGKEQIAESLSTAAITTILGAFITYALKSFGEKKIGKEKEDDYENDFTEIDQ